MKRVIYQVYVGNKSKLYDHCVSSVADYCKLHNIEHVVQKTPILMIRPDPMVTNRSREAVDRLGYLPIYEKENALSYLHGYDQVAVIDSDVWIRPGSPNVFEALGTDVDFGGTIERNLPITEQYRNKIRNYSRMQYSTLKRIDWKWNDSGAEFFNMGVMLMNRSMLKFLKGETPAQFLRRPEFKGFIDGLGNWKWSTDQTLLNTWVKEEKMKTKDMGWEWNSLFTAVLPEYSKKANFVHFFLKDKLPMKGEHVPSLMRQVE